MFNLLRRPRSTRPAGRPNTRALLRVDGLEARATPSDFYGNDGRYGDINPVNKPPVITGFTYEVVGDGAIMVTGRVVDEHPGGLTVTISGLGSGTSTTQSDGTFTIIVSIPFAGSVTASVTDDAGQTGTATQLVNP